ncbi:MAG: NYN domain-containing protein [Bacteroidetes bacterium]|jgi:predicted RNA-binding protein with PIN domain|nr:NYN domain-containing protein [Bacteroidota bacterium]
MHWIVDGYNVILADARLSKLIRRDSESARSELLREVMKFAGTRRHKVTLIYDGKFSTPTEKVSASVEIRFSRPNETADDLIKREIGNSERRRSLFVVTDDLAIIGYAKECGANAVGSREFMLQVRGSGLRTGNQVEHGSEKPEPSGNPDLELLRVFGVKK